MVRKLDVPKRRRSTFIAPDPTFRQQLLVVLALVIFALAIAVVTVVSIEH